MAMSKKDYEITAEALHKARKGLLTNSGSAMMIFNELVNDLAAAYKQANPRFRRDWFLDDVRGEDR